MSIWGRSKLAGGARADEPEYISYGPLYDEDGPGDPEFGAWLDEKLGLKGTADAESPLPDEPKKRTRRWWIKRGLLAFAALFLLLLAWLAITAPLSKSLQPIAPPQLTLLAADGTPIARNGAVVDKPVEVEDLLFLKAHTDRLVKITVPGPFTMSCQAQNDHYPSDEAAAMDYAVAVNAEIRDLFAAGADIVQIDEPYMQARPEKARQYGLKALNVALEGITGTTAVHICFGYAAIIHERPSGYSFLPELTQCSCRQVSVETAQSRLDCSTLAGLAGKQVMVGCIDLADPAVESAATIVERIERALPYVKAENVILAPDCGMKYLPRERAVGKLRAMVEAAKILRQRHATTP